jgi:hypothetical protein
MDKDIIKAISRHTIWGYKAIEFAHDVLKSWDKTIIATEWAEKLAVDLDSMAIILSDPARKQWRVYNIPADIWELDRQEG